MKKVVSGLILTVLIFVSTYGQDTSIPGKPIAEIFTDFHYNINDTSKTTGFGLNRAHLGYHYTPGGNISGTVIVNVGSPEDLVSGAKHRRYAFFREASLTYTYDKLIVTMGITDTRIFNYQQKFWGKRYIANTYQSINGYGYVADLGLVIDYKFNDIFKSDITIMNGEGYSEVQLDNSLKSSAGLTITPGSNFSFKVYADIMKPAGIFQHTLVGFAGFRNKLITIGGEVSYKSNLDLTEGHNAWGISGTGGVSVTEKNEIFIRYDYSTSVIPDGETLHWHNSMDGNFLIAGIQHTFNQNAKLALNYQGTYPFSKTRQNTGAIFVNALFKF